MTCLHYKTTHSFEKNTKKFKFTLAIYRPLKSEKERTITAPRHKKKENTIDAFPFCMCFMLYHHMRGPPKPPGPLQFCLRESCAFCALVYFLYCSSVKIPFR